MYFWSRKKHCDVFDLQYAWTNGKIKENAEAFLAALFNLNTIAIGVDDSNEKEIYLDDMILDFDDDSDDTDDEVTETPSCRTITKSIRTYSTYQMIVYTVTDEKIKTPLHVMAGQSVYSRCLSHSTIASLNKIGVSTSYDDVRRGRDLLALYAIKKSQDNLTPIPSHFRTAQVQVLYQELLTTWTWKTGPQFQVPRRQIIALLLFSRMLMIHWLENLM